MPSVQSLELSQNYHISQVVQNNTGELVRNLQSDVDEIKITSSTCELYALLQFSKMVKKDSLSYRDGVIETYARAAAIALAAEHLNTGNGSLIQEIKGLNDSCPLNFTLRFNDTEGQPGTALNQIYEAAKISKYQVQPCSYIGATNSDVSEATATLTGFKGRVQVSGDSTSLSLDNSGHFPFFARSITSDRDNVRSFLRFLRHVLNVKYLAILNSNNNYGNMYAQAMREANRELGLNMVFYQRPADVNSLDNSRGSTSRLGDIIKDLKDSSFTYIYCIITPSDSDEIDDFDRLLEEAYKQGIAGPDSKRTWLFSDTFNDNQLDKRTFPSDNVLAKAYQGVSRLEVASNSQALSGRGLYHEFEQQISQLLPANEDYFRSIFPPITTIDGDSEVPFLDDPTFLQPPLSSNIPFLYEAAISLGISACNAVNKKQSHWGGNLWSKSQYEELTKLNFTGISGVVRFDDTTGTRLSNTVLCSVTNFQATESRDGERLVNFKAVLTNLEENGQWNQENNYVYADGTSNVPSDTLPPKVMEVSMAWLIISLIMCGILCTLSLGFSTWTFVHRKSRVVQSSQPIFLYLLCSGVTLINLSIIPLASTSDTACNATTWFFNIGISLTFSALFSKTWRINKIMNSGHKFKKIKVTAFDAAIPMICLMGANILVLILMTVLDPDSVETVVTKYDSYGRATEIFDRCDASEQRYWFYLALLLINSSAVGGAIYQAWRARHLSLEYAESKYIFQALQVTVVVIFVAAPIIILSILYAHPNILLFTVSAVIFVFGCSILFLIFAPKIKSSKEKRRERITITGFHPNNTTVQRAQSTAGVKILSDLSPEDMITKMQSLEAQLQDTEAKLRVESEKAVKMGNTESSDQTVQIEALHDKRSSYKTVSFKVST